MRFPVPFVPLVVFALVALAAAVAGLPAAVIASRRASRLEVLDALQYE